jgi:hypothetical protein
MNRSQTHNITVHAGSIVRRKQSPQTLLRAGYMSATPASPVGGARLGRESRQ